MLIVYLDLNEEKKILSLDRRNMAVKEVTRERRAILKRTETGASKRARSQQGEGVVVDLRVEEVDAGVAVVDVGLVDIGVVGVGEVVDAGVVVEVEVGEDDTIKYVNNISLSVILS